jgi:acyl carrier protein
MKGGKIMESTKINQERLNEIEAKVKDLLITHMQLDVKAEDIDPTEEYFLEAFGFNSVDALELLLRIEQEFDIEISDENLNAELVKNVRSIASYVLEKLNEN